MHELVTFAIRASDPAMLEAVMKVQNMVEDHCIKQAAVGKQKSIGISSLLSDVNVMWGNADININTGYGVGNLNIIWVILI